MSSNVVKRGTARALPRVEWRVWSAATGVSAGVSAPAGPGVPFSAGPAADAARLEKEAHERGFREGEAAGARRSLEQFQASIRAFAESAAALAGYKSTLRSQAERELVSLSLSVARKIVRRELSVDPNIVLAVVQACLGELRSAEIYRLRLHPQDVQPVAAYFEQQQQGRIEMVPDSKLTRGGAIFETSQGVLDARFDTQLGEIERGLADR